MSGFDDGEEEYRGMVTVLLSEGSSEDFEVQAHLAGHFSPLTGDYRWKGRLSAEPGITRAYERGARTVIVRTPDGHEGVGTLDTPNLWGGHPVNGSGTPPFAVPRIDLDD
ncbi:hypothetical protein GCM10007079_45630 [Nocardiopsis terrae]|uniref:DUF4873 domain-containing protein n=1 Tax=Nocardiopsis terrae TaxID=372655 RepID=A0ABR9HKS3_9ACTN|nr:DUF4873 domain-containing protein [Nocardiopsis terrae]MBE1459627.1 hypothetical protein [Nocardiopsis terrae]GHC94800.1 hypothetical protein GCM10007079_45630 [Nocardiopsis terrae]